MDNSRNPNLGLLPRPSRSQIKGCQTNLGKISLDLSIPRPIQWFTGVHPALCKGTSVTGTLHSLEIPNLNTCSRQEVSDYFDNTWTLTEVLFSGLAGEEAFYRPPYHSLRHPLVFYYVHPACLYVNKLRLAGLLDTPLNEYFESLFETGVDEMSWDDMSKNEMDWPDLDACHEYRRLAYLAVRNVIESHPGLEPGHPPIEQNHPLWALFMAFEHERIHLETSSVLIRELPLNLVTRPVWFPELGELQESSGNKPEAGKDYPEHKLVRVSPKTVEIGKPEDYPTYGWDNEYGKRTEQVPEFLVSNQLISNGEFLKFVEAGGYHDKSYWSETGWRWRSYRNVKWPTFWVPDGPAGLNQYLLRTCFELVPMQWHWPCVVNYHEAQAFCNWKSKNERTPNQYRLITEAEHHAMRKQGETATNCPGPMVSNANLNLRRGSESPVNEHSSGEFFDVFGNVWQWCEDHFNPLPGFRIHKYYDDFSTPCYDGQHQMILGGSFISTGDEAGIWARFHFRPHFFQHAGFRIVSSAEDGCVVRLDEKQSKNEGSNQIDELLIAHYGPINTNSSRALASDFVPYGKKILSLVRDWKKSSERSGKALDVGCTVGGVSISLAELFDTVTGVDLNPEFIKTAQTLLSSGSVSIELPIEGDRKENLKIEVSGSCKQSIVFRQCDPCCLPADYLGFDTVVLNNVLERLPSPMSCLSRMAGSRGMVQVGGLLVVVSSFEWNESVTPRQVWLGGTTDESGNYESSEEALGRALQDHFELLHSCDLPVTTRQSARQTTTKLLSASVWRRRV